MLSLTLDTSTSLPLVEQIVRGVREQIDDRLLRGGSRLPPIRQFATHYGVSRFTVVEAYERLVALGYLQSRRGSGFYVQSRDDSGPVRAAEPVPDRALDVAWVVRSGLDAPDEQLRASAGWLPPSWLPEEEIRRQLRAIAREENPRLTRYGNSMGYLPLREQICVRLAARGVAAQPEQVLLTQGASQALDLVARHLVRPGDAVLVDDPGYHAFFGNLRLQGARLIGVPRTAQGPDPEALERLAAEHKPRFFYTQSALHNPTGTDLSPAVAHRVLRCAEQHDFAILEDDVFGGFQPTPTVRLATLDQLARVIYVNSFSKTISADLRVGYVAANPALIAALRDLKLLTNNTSPEMNESVVHGMLIGGQYRRHCERLRERLDAARASTLRMLERTGCEVPYVPSAGVFLWVRKTGVEDAAPLVDAAAQSGILLAPGQTFRPQMQASPYFRINIAYGGDRRLERFLSQYAPG
ncbi:PLP-dependent aminotransferase family protein [Niveibacterium sp. COAC-50]|uniref:aminotransferase-like domain-containing protein n=1 Tax=Niveibacterium sp. COAC-50 TaxID=2729384 RepID=UPI001557A7D4|nr:PLP-dependent aminotransferase family protein [Niveibacterium sp. COAC-50]